MDFLRYCIQYAFVIENNWPQGHPPYSSFPKPHYPGYVLESKTEILVSEHFSSLSQYVAAHRSFCRLPFLFCKDLFQKKYFSYNFLGQLLFVWNCIHLKSKVEGMPKIETNSLGRTLAMNPWCSKRTPRSAMTLGVTWKIHIIIVPWGSYRPVAY